MNEMDYAKYVEQRHRDALMKHEKERLVDIILQLEKQVEELGGDLEDIDWSYAFLLDETCPNCGKPFEVVALASTYVIHGCPDHREFDKTTYFEEP